MFEIRVEADFSAAHFLTNYHGKPERLHGHNYKVFAHAKEKTLNEGGLLLDFAVLQKALKEVSSELDHRNLNDFSFFEGNPSAEKIAMYIFNEIKKRYSNIPLYAIDVFETPTSRARYTAD